MGRQSYISFTLMTLGFAIRDLVRPRARRIAGFGIREGFTVIDFGCGPGGYLKRASELAGGRGRVYAVDVNELAIKAVNQRIEKQNLENVEAILTDGHSVNLVDHCADLIYALDVFHLIREPGPFLKELHRLLKTDGVLIIDDGHQSRRSTERKMLHSGLWVIGEETRDHLKCYPK